MLDLSVFTLDKSRRCVSLMPFLERISHLRAMAVIGIAATMNDWLDMARVYKGLPYI